MQLSDEIAQEVVREAARAKLERCLGTALDAIKKRTLVRDYSPVVQVGLLKAFLGRPSTLSSSSLTQLNSRAWVCILVFLCCFSLCLFVVFLMDCVSASWAIHAQIGAKVCCL